MQDYIDDDSIKNFRTSETASMGDDAIGQLLQRRAWLVTRLPILTCVESTQVVRYSNPKSWYCFLISFQ